MRKMSLIEVNDDLKNILNRQDFLTEGKTPTQTKDNSTGLVLPDTIEVLRFDDFIKNRKR